MNKSQHPLKNVTRSWGGGVCGVWEGWASKSGQGAGRLAAMPSRDFSGDKRFELLRSFWHGIT
eukprot:4136368-Pyramimonas_sp.AAC.1